MVWARAHLQVTAVLDILKGAQETVDFNARPTLHEVFFQSSKHEQAEGRKVAHCGFQRGGQTSNASSTTWCAG